MEFWLVPPEYSPGKFPLILSLSIYQICRHSKLFREEGGGEGRGEKGGGGEELGEEEEEDLVQEKTWPRLRT